MQDLGIGRERFARRFAFAVVAVCFAACPSYGASDAERIVAESHFCGGLIVQVGCRDAELAVSLAQAPNVLMQGLVADAGRLEEVRRQIRTAGQYGRVSATAWQGPWLPYADGMVNLLVVDSGVELDRAEIDRVLAPLGTAWIRGGDGRLTTYRKPWPEDVDQWSHSRHDATGNAVSGDRRVGPPRYLQWEATPRWNHGVKTSSMVTMQGRIFYILDDSDYSVSARTWSLIARDAANGIQLWRHELPSWGGAQGGKKVGPAQMHRHLVADETRVYATLGEFAPVSVLDAATGEPIRTLKPTARAEEIILSDGILVALVNPNTATDVRRGNGKRKMRVVAMEADSGKLLWQHASEMVMPMTLAADGAQVVFHDGKAIESLDLRSGEPRWTSPPTGQKIDYWDKANPDSPGAEKSTIVLAPQFAPTLVIYNDVVAFAGGRQLNVVSAADGSELWRSEYAPSNYSVPVDLFGFGDCLWGPDPKMNLWRPLDDNLDYNAFDPQTGELEKSVSGHYGFRFQHHRCHQMKVVGSTVLGARAGIEFLDTESGELTAHHWTRGSCYYGILPANGRLYTPPHDCACYIRAKLSGFLAMNANAPTRTIAIPEDSRLIEGPAYGETGKEPQAARADDWPTHRHDPARSGRATCRLGADLLLGWRAQAGGRLTAPVIADGRVYVASTDDHTLQAYDAAKGELLWQTTLDARIDSPPTIYEGLVLCGCRDGSVWALRAEDGTLVWRFLAAPEERRIVSRGQLESVWPVSGSVLVAKGLVYFAAGRSSYLDGGIRLYGLEPHTGRKVVDQPLSTLGADSSEVMDEQGVEGYLNDILSSDGERIFMRHQVFDLAGHPKPERVTHLHGPDGFLSGETTNRLPWVYAPLFTSPHQGAFYDLRLSRVLFPAGRLLVEDSDTIFGYGQNRYGHLTPDPGGQWALFAAEKQSDVPLDLTAFEYRKVAVKGQSFVRFRWWNQLPIQVRAMVQTDDVLLVAGPPGNPSTSVDALEGKTPASLLAVSPVDGKILAEMMLPATPVWDGLAAAGGSLFASLANGDVLCLWPADSGRPGKPLTPRTWNVALPPLELAPEPGLVGRWRFDEGIGMLARDCSGQDHDAVVSGAWGEDDRGPCLVADGTPRAAVITDASHLHFGNDDFTLALWVKPDAYDERLLGKEAFPENWWVINVLNDGRVELVLGEGQGNGRSVRASTKTALSKTDWNHLAAVVDRQAGEVRWYVNGRLDSRQAIPKTMTRGIDGAGQDLAIPSRHKPLHGRVSDLRIYRRAISEQRVKELFEERGE